MPRAGPTRAICAFVCLRLSEAVRSLDCRSEPLPVVLALSGVPVDLSRCDTIRRGGLGPRISELVAVRIDDAARGSAEGIGHAARPRGNCPRGGRRCACVNREASRRQTRWISAEGHRREDDERKDYAKHDLILLLSVAKQTTTRRFPPNLGSQAYDAQSVTENTCWEIEESPRLSEPGHGRSAAAKPSAFATDLETSGRNLAPSRMLAERSLGSSRNYSVPRVCSSDTRVRTLVIPAPLPVLPPDAGPRPRRGRRPGRSAPASCARAAAARP